MQQNVTLDLNQFRKGVAAIGRMNGQVEAEDYAEVEKCMQQLDSLGKTPEQFLGLPPHLRVFVRAGARNSCKGKMRYNQDLAVFHLVRELVGITLQIKTDLKKREMVDKFFRGVASMD